MKTTWQMSPHELRDHHAHQVAEITQLLETTHEDEPVYRTTAGGDEQKLRGIPAIGRGVAGAIPGTTPHNIRS